MYAPSGPPPALPSHPLGHHRAPSWSSLVLYSRFPSAIYSIHGIYVNHNLPTHPTLSFLPCVHRSFRSCPLYFLFLTAVSDTFKAECATASHNLQRLRISRRAKPKPLQQLTRPPRISPVPQPASRRYLPFCDLLSAGSSASAHSTPPKLALDQLAPLGTNHLTFDSTSGALTFLGNIGIL